MKWRGRKLIVYEFLGATVAGVALFLILDFTTIPKLVGRVFQYFEPSLQLPIPRISIGEISGGSEHSLLVPVQNVDWRDIKIVGARSTCGCIQLVDIPTTVPAFRHSCLHFICRPKPSNVGAEMKSSFELMLSSGEEVTLEISATVK